MEIWWGEHIMNATIAAKMPRIIFGLNMDARTFCRRWFKSTPEEEGERGYREKCIHLLSQVLKINANSIQRWGKGMDLETPDTYKAALAYADILREMIENTYGSTDILRLVLEEKERKRD